MAQNMKLSNGTMVVTFNETKGNAVKNYEMYTEGIKALCEIGRVATLKVVEAIVRVDLGKLWKLGNSVKTGLPYNSINEWAIAEFGYSKSHVSEMLSVAKQCCDPETGAPLDVLAGYSYTQLLAFTKNPNLLLQVKAGEEVDGISLASTAKDIKDWGKKALEDKSKSEQEQREEQEQGEEQESDSKPSKSENSRPHEKRDVVVKMTDIERWYNMLSDTSDKDKWIENVADVAIELGKLAGNPFAE